ncbi:hypothetical protein K3727_23035 (plasmid) [Rhodobacteraceae bacterium M382]|nr:hypothetical protein K3727_23035 [Rhodobacteraceae bacterium M382]
MSSDTILGSNFGDTIQGGVGDDAIYGGPGGNYIHGGNDTDIFVGGDGNDTIAGGAVTSSTTSLKVDALGVFARTCQVPNRHMISINTRKRLKAKT